MLKTQAIKSAAEEWFEEGLRVGLLIGEIQFLQHRLKHPVTPQSELVQLSVDALSLLVSTLRLSAEQN
jgi:hypothetical protein